MDCAAFQDAELDALYDDVDAETSAAMEAHASGCTDCAARLGKLRAMRRVISPVLLDELPSGLEDRVVAAAVAALPPVAVTRATAQAAGGAKVFAFLARPQLAVAAGLVLVLGAAAFYMNRSAAPASDAVASKAAGAPAAEEGLGSPVATTTASPISAGAPMASAMAFADEPPSPAPGRSKGGAKSLNDPAFVTAKALYDDGRCGEALPKLEALAKTNADADLYAARCVEQTKGCKVAAPRYDVTAKRNVGTEVGSRASLESARCYDSSGQEQAARTRYKSLENDPYVASEAKNNLESLDKPRPTPATPPATAKPQVTPTLR